MAELTAGVPRPATQFAAVTWLRWRMFLNGFRRKGSKGDVVALAIMLPLFLLVVLSVALGTGAAAYFFTSQGHVERVAAVLWAIFVLAQMSNINLGQPGTTFDPTQLIRFPLRLGSYVAIRLFFGVLSPSNLIVTMISVAVAVGVTLAQPALWIAAFVAMAVFAVTNVLFTRMVFAWVDRWLSTRRAREVFTAVIFALSMGFQWANFTFNPAYHQRDHHKDVERVNRAMHVYALAKPYLAGLPPGLTAEAMHAAAQQRVVVSGEDVLLCGLYGLAFLAVFGVRMRTEYRGENLSDAAAAITLAKPARKAVEAPVVAAPATDEAVPGWKNTVAAVFAKDVLYLRRNLGLFYGLIAPLAMVMIFAGKMSSRNHAEWVFPAALSYALLGVVPVSYNAFGMDAMGSQVYFLAPVRMRDVLLAKNLLNLVIAAVEVVAVVVLVTAVAAPPSGALLIGSLFWAGATLLVAITVGNYRSLNTPKRIDPGRTAQKQASPLSALLSMGILLVAAGVGWSVMTLASSFHMTWVLPVAMLLLLVAAAAVYWNNLQRMDAYALVHRESLFEELSKKA